MRVLHPQTPLTPYSQYKIWGHMEAHTAKQEPHQCIVMKKIR